MAIRSSYKVHRTKYGTRDILSKLRREYYKTSYPNFGIFFYYFFSFYSTLRCIFSRSFGYGVSFGPGKSNDTMTEMRISG